MKRTVSLGVMGFLATAATSFGQIQLNTSVQLKTNDGSDGATSINVTAGQVVEYQVKGTLSPGTGHMGLALVGFNLAYSGGDLQQANTPANPDGTCATAMGNFKKNFGITNPAGYGGTIIGGDLVQVGGGQNTIKNVDSADFPIGAVKTGVAQPIANSGCGPAVLATGSLTIPNTAAGGTVYTLALSELFANVIGPGQNGTEEFWATIAANPGTSSPLTMTVAAANNVTVASSFPATNTRLWRSTKNRVRITFTGNITAPNPGDIQIRELLPAGAFGSNLSGSFTASVNGADLILTDTGTTLQNKKWYRVSQSGTWGGVDAFGLDFLVQAGDANNDGFTNATDLGVINSSIPTLPANITDTNRRRDINGDNIVNASDLGAANSFIPGLPVTKPTGH